MIAGPLVALKEEAYPSGRAVPKMAGGKSHGRSFRGRRLNGGESVKVLVQITGAFGGREDTLLG
jgi:hypothetical protein